MVWLDAEQLELVYARARLIPTALRGAYRREVDRELQGKGEITPPLLRRAINAAYETIIDRHRRPSPKSETEEDRSNNG
jgi:hypothetical protein